MRGRIVKIQIFIFSLLAAISIFVSPISACACSHHSEPKTEVESTSCHENSSESKAEKDFDATTICEGDCVCVQTAPKTFVKSETVKLDVQTARISQIDLPEFKPSAQKIQAKFYFVKPFYLSDSFYNLSPGRAPPVL